MLGYLEEELTGRTFVDITHPDDVDKDVSLAEQVFKGKIPSYVLEKRYIKKHGETLWISLTATVVRDEGGNALYGLAMIEDSTDRKQAEQALRETEERFRSLVEHTKDILWELDQEGAYTYVSPNVKDILGYSPEYLIGKTPFEFMPKKEAKRVGQIFAQIVQEGRLFTSLQHKALCKRGNVILLESSGRPFTNTDGTFQGYRPYW